MNFIFHLISPNIKWQFMFNQNMKNSHWWLIYHLICHRTTDNTLHCTYLFCTVAFTFEGCRRRQGNQWGHDAPFLSNQEINLRQIIKWLMAVCHTCARWQPQALQRDSILPGEEADEIPQTNQLFVPDFVCV